MTQTPIHAELTRDWFAKEAALTDTLATLVNDGMGYLDACRLTFHGPGLDATPAERAAWVEHVVRREIDDMVARLPWYREAS